MDLPGSTDTHLSPAEQTLHLSKQEGGLTWPAGKALCPALYLGHMSRWQGGVWELRKVSAETFPPPPPDSELQLNLAAPSSWPHGSGSLVGAGPPEWGRGRGLQVLRFLAV